jgi:hypothetical protein
VSIHIVPLQQLTGEDVDRFYRVIIEDRQSTILEMWQVRPLIENTPSDPKGGWNMWGML